LARVIHRRTS
jgi:dinuclear metal center YbgI/SA1388 family protein